MAKYADIAVKGSVENIQNLALQAFTSNGFTIQWDGPTKGKAQKGSKGANILLGAMAQHHSVTFEIYPATEGGTLRLINGGFRRCRRTPWDEKGQQTIRPVD